MKFFIMLIVAFLSFNNVAIGGPKDVLVTEDMKIVIQPYYDFDTEPQVIEFIEIDNGSDHVANIRFYNQFVSSIDSHNNIIFKRPYGNFSVIIIPNKGENDSEIIEVYTPDGYCSIPAYASVEDRSEFTFIITKGCLLF